MAEEAQAVAFGVEPDERLFVESVAKAMRVLDVFRCDRPLSVAEVARATGIGRSAAQRFIHTWAVMNYIRRAEGGKGYVLTPRVLDTAHQYYRSHYVLERAHPYLVEAGRRAQERVGFGEIDQTDYVLLFQTPSPRSSDPRNIVATRYPAYLSTSGLAIMAFLPDAEVEAILARTDLKPVTSHTVTDPAAIRALLAEVRARGYCISEQLSDYGRIAVSAPVFEGSHVIGAVNISTLLVRHSRASVEAELMPIAFETAQTISSLFRK
ncbi:MAG: IclR family transcriptional regulator [Alphaproteobacteria bacterium]